MPPIRKNIQLCYPFSEQRLFNQGQIRSTWSLPAWADFKLNGERGRAVVTEDGQRSLLFSSTSELITTLPHINKAVLAFGPGEYDAELYHHGWSHARIHSAISTTSRIHEDASKIEFHLFDIPSLKGPQIERIAKRKELVKLSFHPCIKEVYGRPVHSLAELMTFFDEALSQRYEGFVVKDLYAPYISNDPAYRSPYWMKFKPRQQDTYPIMSFIQAISKDGIPLQLVGAFKCHDPEGNVFKVGAGHLTHSERKDLWKRFTQGETFEDYELLIEYQTLSDAAGVPLFSRAVKLVKL